MIKVTVKNNPSIVSQVKNYSAGAQNLSLGQLTNVDASDADNNETLVYDETQNKFVIKILPIVQGGTF